MPQTTIALGLVTALDVTTARQLHDYTGLDDTGVIAAQEQMTLQRSHSRALPGYLTRIQQVAAVIDSGDDITLAAFEADDLDAERGVLTSLFALLPDAGACAVVWHSAHWQLLLRRALRHELPAPGSLQASTCHAWDRWFAEGQDESNAAVQADAVRLYGHHAAAQQVSNPALRAAMHWYELDLRWRSVTGGIDMQTRRERRARVLAHVHPDTTQVRC